jgi:serine/threonine protein kinase
MLVKEAHHLILVNEEDGTARDRGRTPHADAMIRPPENSRTGRTSSSVVLWEMLTAHRLFEGATVSDTLAAVLKTEPDWNALATTTPSAVRRLLRRCLEKDRKRRLDSAAAARLEIEEGLAGRRCSAMLTDKHMPKGT